MSYVAFQGSLVNKRKIRTKLCRKEYNLHILEEICSNEFNLMNWHDHHSCSLVKTSSYLVSRNTMFMYIQMNIFITKYAYSSLIMGK